MPENTEPATQSVQAAAPSVTNESNVTPVAPAEQQEVPEPQSQPLTPEEQRYLQSQNIDLAKYGIDPTNHEGVDNFINMHKSLRATRSQQVQQERNASNVTPEDVMGKAQETTQQPAPTVVTPSPRGISETDVVAMTFMLQNQYPLIKDKIASSEFYDGMRRMGFNPVREDGTYNSQAAQQYASILSIQVENQQLKEKLNTPNPALIPNTSDKMTSLSSFTTDTLSSVDSAEKYLILANQLKRRGQTLSPDEQVKYAKAVQILTDY